MTEFAVSAQVNPFVIYAEGLSLAATVHLPQVAHEIGVVIVTGGNQVRTGSHRQFLRLARTFAGQGYACLRFDLPGLGDSDGELLPFDENAFVLRAAIDALLLQASSVKCVVLWGLCDGATAAALYGPTDPRVAGLILANPWGRTEQALAQALVKTYYRQRLVSPAFWGKVLCGKIGLIRSASEWLGNWRTARSRVSARDEGLPAQLARALSEFSGITEIIIAEQDLTGQEFLLIAESVNSSTPVRISKIANADHTFSTRVWHEELASLSLNMLLGLSHRG